MKRRRSVNKQHTREFTPSDSLKKFIPPLSDMGGTPSPEWDIGDRRPMRPRPAATKKPAEDEQAALGLG